MTGNKRNNWKFLELLNRILADKPSTKRPILVDMLTIHSDENLQHDSSAEPSSSTENTSLNDTSSTETRSLNTSIEGSLPDCEEVDGPNNDSVRDSTKISKPLKRGSKRKGREDRMEKIFNGVMDKLLHAQAENDKKFYELEEKWLRFEQSQKEREENEKGRKGISIKVIWDDGPF